MFEKMLVLRLILDSCCWTLFLEKNEVTCQRGLKFHMVWGDYSLDPVFVEILPTKSDKDVSSVLCVRVFLHVTLTSNLWHRFKRDPNRERDLQKRGSFLKYQYHCGDSKCSTLSLGYAEPGKTGFQKWLFFKLSKSLTFFLNIQTFQITIWLWFFPG